MPPSGRSRASILLSKATSIGLENGHIQFHTQHPIVRGGHRDDWDVAIRRVFPHSSEQIDAAHERHEQIRNQKVRPLEI